MTDGEHTSIGKANKSGLCVADAYGLQASEVAADVVMRIAKSVLSCRLGICYQRNKRFSVRLIVVVSCACIDEITSNQSRLDIIIEDDVIDIVCIRRHWCTNEIQFNPSAARHLHRSVMRLERWVACYIRYHSDNGPRLLVTRPSLLRCAMMQQSDVLSVSNANANGNLLAIAAVKRVNRRRCRHEFIARHLLARYTGNLWEAGRFVPKRCRQNARNPLTHFSSVFLK